GARPPHGLGVVAVQRVRDVPDGADARDEIGERRAEAVAVLVAVPGGRVDGGVLVDHAVAVVVGPIAALDVGGAAPGVVIVAVTADGHVVALGGAGDDGVGVVAE